VIANSELSNNGARFGGAINSYCAKIMSKEYNEFFSY
jgi:hypothetical protein